MLLVAVSGRLTLYCTRPKIALLPRNTLKVSSELLLKRALGGGAAGAADLGHWLMKLPFVDTLLSSSGVSLKSRRSEPNGISTHTERKKKKKKKEAKTAALRRPN